MKDSQFCSIHVVRSIFIAQIAQSAKNGLCTHIRTVPDLYGTLAKYQQNVQVLDGQGFSDLVEIGQAAAAARRKFSKINSYLHVLSNYMYLPVDLQPYY